MDVQGVPTCSAFTYSNRISDTHHSKAVNMNVLASTSTACYACVAAQAARSGVASSFTVRFSSNSSMSRQPRNDTEGDSAGLMNVVRPKTATLQTRALIDELKKLQLEDKVKIDRSVLVTGKEMSNRA